LMLGLAAMSLLAFPRADVMDVRARVYERT
jgi:hypothetical protein